MTEEEQLEAAMNESKREFEAQQAKRGTPSVADQPPPTSSQAHDAGQAGEQSHGRFGRQAQQQQQQAEHQQGEQSNGRAQLRSHPISDAMSEDGSEEIPPRRRVGSPVAPADHIFIDGEPKDEPMMHDGSAEAMHRTLSRIRNQRGVDGPNENSGFRASDRLSGQRALAAGYHDVHTSSAGFHDAHPSAAGYHDQMPTGFQSPPARIVVDLAGSSGGQRGRNGGHGVWPDGTDDSWMHRRGGASDLEHNLAMLGDAVSAIWLCESMHTVACHQLRFPHRIAVSFVHYERGKRVVFASGTSAVQSENSNGQRPPSCGQPNSVWLHELD